MNSLLEKYLNSLNESDNLHYMDLRKLVTNNTGLLIVGGEKPLTKLNKNMLLTIFINYNNKLYNTIDGEGFHFKDNFLRNGIIDQSVVRKNDDSNEIDELIPNIEDINTFVNQIKSKKSFKNIYCSHNSEFGSYGNSGYYSSFAFGKIKNVIVNKEYDDDIEFIEFSNFFYKPLINFSKIYLKVINDFDTHLIFK